MTFREENLGRLGRAYEEGREVVSAGPAVLYLEAAAVCNLRCPMCPTTIGLPREPYRTTIFDLSLLPRLEKVLPGVARAFLSGGGEPLLHPRFFDLVRALKRHRIEVYFNSNATLLHEEIRRRIIAAGVDTISFSVDAATPETYRRLRTPADFRQTLENIRGLDRLKRKLNSPRPFLNLQFTLWDENEHELEKMVPLAAELGINHLVIEPLTPVYNFDLEYRAFYETHAVPAERVLPALRRASAAARKLGLIFSSHYLFAAQNPAPPKTCPQPWLTFGVRVDGRVFTCCGMIEPMGDLGRESFADIWNGPKYRELRRQLACGEMPAVCGWCMAENRANHFNEDLLPQSAEIPGGKAGGGGRMP